MEFGCEVDGSQDYFQPFWPVVVAHRIDSSSPLYTYTPKVQSGGVENGNLNGSQPRTWLRDSSRSS